MANLKNNFHGNYQDNNCAGSFHEPGDEEHLTALAHNSVHYIESSYRITNYYEVFENDGLTRDVGKFCQRDRIEEQ